MKQYIPNAYRDITTDAVKFPYMLTVLPASIKTQPMFSEKWRLNPYASKTPTRKAGGFKGVGFW